MPPFTIQQAFDLAAQHHQAGRLQEAETLYRQILAQQPDHADALHLIGVLANQTGRNAIATALIRRAIALKPNDAEACCNLGNVLRDGGQLLEAIAACENAIALNPALPQAYSNLGNALKDHGQIDRAIAAYRRAIALKPDYAGAYSNLGVALKEKGLCDDAIAAWRQAILLNPGFDKAYSNLGNALREMGRLDEAIAACRQAIDLNPNSPEARKNLADALADMSNLDPAVATSRRAIAGKPSLPEAHNNLGNALKNIGQLAESVAAYRQAIALRPDYAVAHSNLSVPLKDMGRLDEALAVCRKAIALAPALPEAYLNLGNILKETGEIGEAIVAYRQAIALRPDYADAGSNLLYAIHFHSDYDARSIAEEHSRWNRQYAAPLRSLPYPPFPNSRGADRPLRIGYVSPDFRSHPVGRFLLPLMDHHDRASFEIFCYSDVLSPDFTTRRIQSRADIWRNIVGMTDDAVAAMIRRDKIDVLIDLTMHMARNRLVVFARKPAPVQVTYLAYCSTTGLDAMDYRLTDPHIDPHGQPDECYSEKSIRLPDTYWCYDPGPRLRTPSPRASGEQHASALGENALVQDPRPPTPDVAPLPALAAGRVTFGCLNNFAKVSPEALSTWIQLLKALPTSRLVLHARPGEHRRRTLDRIQQEGVDPIRIAFVDFLKGQDYFRQYHQIDIGLDPFPYAGGTTTCDAMWMGVPVITLAGRTAVGRAGVTLLTNVGLNELIAKTREQYIHIAVKLASDLPRLARLRAELRQRMLRSPLMNATKFARDVEAAYRQMWRQWCETDGMER